MLPRFLAAPYPLAGPNTPQSYIDGVTFRRAQHVFTVADFVSARKWNTRVGPSECGESRGRSRSTAMFNEDGPRKRTEQLRDARRVLSEPP